MVSTTVAATSTTTATGAITVAAAALLIMLLRIPVVRVATTPRLRLHHRIQVTVTRVAATVIVVAVVGSSPTLQSLVLSFRWLQQIHVVATELHVLVVVQRLLLHHHRTVDGAVPRHAAVPRTRRHRVQVALVAVVLHAHVHLPRGHDDGGRRKYVPGSVQVGGQLLQRRQFGLVLQVALHLVAGLEKGILWSV